MVASPELNKTSTVVKQFVVDFTSETYKPLMEREVNGLDYRYVYSDKVRLSVVVQGIENGSASLLDSNGELHAYLSMWKERLDEIEKEFIAVIRIEVK